jgi:hypothetical protein
MAIANDSYFKYQEQRAQTGYKAAILVKEQSSNYYSLLVASETVPSVFGTQDSFEFDLLNSPVKGKVAGKMTLDDKEVEVLHHRDNVYRFEKLKGKVLDFMYVDSQFVGYKFTGTLSYRANDATADVLRGTYTITPMSADPTPVMDARPLCMETLCFADVIPETVKMGDQINISVIQEVGTPLKFSVDKYSDGKWKLGGSASQFPENGKLEISSTNGFDGSGLYAITVNAGATYATWTTTVYVEAASAT